MKSTYVGEIASVEIRLTTDKNLNIKTKNSKRT